MKLTTYFTSKDISKFSMLAQMIIISTHLLLDRSFSNKKEHFEKAVKCISSNFPALEAQSM